MQILPALEQGGVESVVTSLNRTVVGEGWESVVISSGGALVAEIERDGGRHLTLGVKSKNPFTFLFRAAALRRALVAERPDLVCVHSRLPAWLYLRAARGLGIRWITYAHGANSVSRYSEVMTRGDAVVTPSEFLADYLRANYRFDHAKIRVINPAVDGRRFDPANLDLRFVGEKRREWDIGDGDRVLMAVGRITPVKGYDRLIADYLAGRHPGFTRLVIVGGADRSHREYADRLRALADGNPGRGIVFAGPQTRIPECLSLADAVVSANVTKPETFGISVVEAYAMDKIVVAKRFGGVAEVMAAVEGEIASGRAKGLRDAALSLYGTEVLRRKTVALYREFL